MRNPPSTSPARGRSFLLPPSLCCFAREQPVSDDEPRSPEESARSGVSLMRRARKRSLGEAVGDEPPLGTAPVLDSIERRHSASPEAPLSSPEAPLSSPVLDASLALERDRVLAAAGADGAILVFDTETSGLGHADVVVQFACEVLDASGEHVLAEYERYWKMPPGAKMSQRALEVHKIGDTKLRSQGVHFVQSGEADFVAELLLGRQPLLVAHNIDFDLRMLNNTFVNHALPDLRAQLRELRSFCTLRAVARTPLGKCKLPLLYEALHGSPPVEPAHDAMGDVRTLRCALQAGIRKGWWTLPISSAARRPSLASFRSSSESVRDEASALAASAPSSRAEESASDAECRVRGA